MTCTYCGNNQHTATSCKWRNTCLACDHIDLRGSVLAKHGFSRCGIDRRAYVFKSAAGSHDCARRKPADVAAVSKRVAWVEGRV